MDDPTRIKAIGYRDANVIRVWERFVVEVSPPLASRHGTDYDSEPLPSFPGAGLLMLSLSIAFSLIEFLLDRVAVVTSITQVGRNSKHNLWPITSMRRIPLPAKGNWRCWALF